MVRKESRVPVKEPGSRFFSGRDQNLTVGQPSGVQLISFTSSLER